MTASQPPRLALELLQRVMPWNDALIGDLIEEFEAGRSRAWFWRQTLLALIHSRPVDRGCDLHVVQPDHLPSRLPPALERKPGRMLTSINMSGVPVSGVGGLGMIATVLLITIVMPAAWWLAMIGLGGGILLGLARVAAGRRYGLSGRDGGPSNTLLGGAESLGHAEGTPSHQPGTSPPLTPFVVVGS